MKDSPQPRAFVLTPEPIDSPTGTERAAAAAAGALRDAGYDVRTLCPAEVTATQAKSPRPGRKYWGAAFEQLLTARRLRGLSADICLTNGPVGFGVRGNQSFHLFHGLYALVAHASRGRLSAAARARLSIEFGTYERLAARGKICLANSNMTARDVRRHFGYQCEVIWLEVDTNEFSPGRPDLTLLDGLRLPDGCRIGMFVGVGRANKGQEVALEVAARVPEISWLLIGEHRAAHPQTPPNVIWLDRVARDVMVHLYRIADVLVSPSRYEPFGLTVAEALASGLPTVTAPTGATELLFTGEAKHPLLVDDPDDVHAFVRGVKWSLANDDARALAMQARGVAVANFSPPVWRQRFLDVIDAGGHPALPDA